MENLILKKLIEDENYITQVIPHISADFFKTQASKMVFNVTKSFIQKYNKKPTYTILANAINKKTNLPETQFNEIIDLLEDLQKNYNEDHDFQWLIDETEEYCKNKAVENAIYKSVDIFENEKEPNTKIEGIISDALKISFKHDLGIEFFKPEHIQARYERMTSPKRKIASHLTEFNTVCGGGIEPKAITVLVGDTHSGKTASMVSLGTSYVRNGSNVLYITCEMSEDKIAQLFDANFIDMEINDIPSMSYESYNERMNVAKEDSYGRLFIREFPTATANVMNFRSLIDDLKLKENFMPDVIIVDYINLMLSMRVTDGKSYTIIKYIAEELRGLAIERNVAVLTATQLNREGAGNTNPSLRETAESYGLPQTADAMFIIYANDELAAKNLIIWKSAKNRFGGIVGHKMVFRTKFNYAMVLNLEEQTDGVPFIKNNEKTVAMMNKMKERMHAKKNNTENTGINSMFSE